VLTLQVFVYLQLLDFLTTLVGFRVGASEASPFIAKLMHLTSPIVGVAASKLTGVAIGALCLATDRARLIGWINYWYALLVTWNLCIILAAIERFHMHH
jgi:hypothetical protein